MIRFVSKKENKMKIISNNSVFQLLSKINQIFGNEKINYFDMYDTNLEVYRNIVQKYLDKVLSKKIFKMSDIEYISDETSNIFNELYGIVIYLEDLHIKIDFFPTGKETVYEVIYFDGKLYGKLNEDENNSSLVLMQFSIQVIDYTNESLKGLLKKVNISELNSLLK